MKIKVSQLRRIIREAYVARYSHASPEALKALAKAAISDLAAGGDPADVYAWLAAETDLGDGQHKGNAVVALVKAKDMLAGTKLERAAREAPMPPAPYKTPWAAGTKGMYETDEIDGEGVGRPTVPHTM